MESDMSETEPPQTPVPRSEQPPIAYAIWIGIIAGIGLITFGVELLHLLVRSQGIYSIVRGMLFLSLSSIIISIAVWIHRGSYKESVGRIASWCFVITFTLVGISVLSMTYQSTQGMEVADPAFVIADHATIGAILGTLMGVYDSQRHQRKQELREEEERTRRLNSQLTVLNRVLRHDIRNSVNIILGYTKVSENDDEIPAEARETIQTKARELQAMSDKARQLESLLEIESTTNTSVDIVPIVHSAIEELQADYPEVEFDLELPESAEVQAPEVVSAAIEELLENAAKHNDSESPSVSVVAESSGAEVETDGGTPKGMRVQIRDNGSGIPEQEIDVLERGHETALEHASGIGLWLVHWVVDAAEGEITYEANHPTGSVVEIRLPAHTESGHTSSSA